MIASLNRVWFMYILVLPGLINAYIFMSNGELLEWVLALIPEHLTRSSRCLFSSEGRNHPPHSSDYCHMAISHTKSAFA